MLLWFVPLLVVSGGPRAYWHALSDQGTEDFVNIQMLWNAHTPRDIADALYYAFIAPWATWPVAVVVLVCAALGLFWLFRHARPALVALAVAFGPYLVFDLVFQETFTGRYALPLVVPMAYLAVSGLRLLPHDTGIAVAVAIAMFDAHVGGTSIAAFAQQKAPAFRLLDEMRDAAASAKEPPVLAMDRRQEFDFRRPLCVGGAKRTRARAQAAGAAAARVARGGEVLERRRPGAGVVRRRSEADEHRSGPAWRAGALSLAAAVSGAGRRRAGRTRWIGIAVDRPEWYVGEGWALTPEAAGVAATDRRGLELGAIDGVDQRAGVDRRRR